ncbi:hypothetical protein BaRGS_00020930 [Batillaria attramentaria]|uniref:Uncharacterized protein n=1 Tax=Batillaria attramentaria TaxID=370345 RepID=A0ABD0KKX7_9CAEN
MQAGKGVGAVEREHQKCLPNSSGNNLKAVSGLIMVCFVPNFSPVFLLSVVIEGNEFAIWAGRAAIPSVTASSHAAIPTHHQLAAEPSYQPDPCLKVFSMTAKLSPVFFYFYFLLMICNAVVCSFRFAESFVSILCRRNRRQDEFGRFPLSPFWWTKSVRSKSNLPATSDKNSGGNAVGNWHPNSMTSAVVSRFRCGGGGTVRTAVQEQMTRKQEGKQLDE